MKCSIKLQLRVADSWIILQRHVSLVRITPDCVDWYAKSFNSFGEIANPFSSARRPKLGNFCSREYITIGAIATALFPYYRAIVTFDYDSTIHMMEQVELTTEWKGVRGN